MIAQLLSQPRTHMALAALLLSAGLFGFWETYRELPRQQTVHTLQDREVILTASHQAARCILAEGGVERVRDATEAYRALLTQLEGYLPQPEDERSILDLITETARETGVQVTSLNPGSTEISEDYEMAPFDVVIEGQYWPIAEFLSAMVEYDQVFKAYDLAVGAVGNAPGALRASLRLESYRGLPRTPEMEIEPGDWREEYSRGTTGDLWLTFTLPGSPDPIRVPVPDRHRSIAEQNIQTGS